MIKRLIIMLFFLSFGFLAKAQNFVSNGDFETYSACPNTGGQISYAIGWNVSAYTPDYYDICAGSNPNFSLPKNSRGYQKDCCAGGGYAGMEVFGLNPGYIVREYIQTKLIDTLTTGHKYLTSMYVSRADDIDYAIATMGMLFTDTVIDITSSLQGFIDANPQVKNTTLLSDTMNWILVQDTITATGNEVYLTIGNFSYDSLSDTVKVGGNGTYTGFAYYYIDGVSVYDVATLGVNNIESTKAEINVYPNPTNNYLKINCNLSLVVYRLEDVLGNTIKTLELKNKEETIDVSNLPEGIYFVSVKTIEGVFTKKIIIHR